MKLLFNGELSFDRWNDLLSVSTFSSPFQTPEFYTLINKTDNSKADVFAIELNDEYVSLAVVVVQKEKGLKSYFSRRGIIYGGLLLREGISDHLQFLIEAIVRYYKGRLIYIETRNFFDYAGISGILNKTGWGYQPWLNIRKDISSQSIAMDSISSSRLRQIKKSIKSGTTWREAASEDEVYNFYLILKGLYHNKIKKPLFDFSFFKSFYHSKAGIYLLVFFGDIIIGGIMCPVLQNKAIYEFYVCGLDSEYKEQYPSVLATWSAIDYGLKNGIPLFDFMGAGSPDKDYGVREFKSRFGGDTVEYGRFVKIMNKPLYFLGKLGIKMISFIK